ncbi:hypothetical protein [Paenibacillus sp. WLX2291]|uniref:hypothetical protein n=1 Tax=Paenibacillus sp. WLX2291 TaxID=3296934 RepID=UPI003984455A
MMKTNTLKMLSGVALSAAILGGTFASFSTASAATPTSTVTHKTTAVTAQKATAQAKPAALTEEQLAAQQAAQAPDTDAPAPANDDATAPAPLPDDQLNQATQPAPVPAKPVVKATSINKVSTVSEQELIIGKIKAITGNKITIYRSKGEDWDSPSYNGATVTYTLTESTPITTVLHDEDGDVVKETKQNLSNLKVGDLLAIHLASGSQKVIEVELMK